MQSRFCPRAPKTEPRAVQCAPRAIPRAARAAYRVRGRAHCGPTAASGRTQPHMNPSRPRLCPRGVAASHTIPPRGAGQAAAQRAVAERKALHPPAPPSYMYKHWQARSACLSALIATPRPCPAPPPPPMRLCRHAVVDPAQQPPPDPGAHPSHPPPILPPQFPLPAHHAAPTPPYTPPAPPSPIDTDPCSEQAFKFHLHPCTALLLSWPSRWRAKYHIQIGSYQQLPKRHATRRRSVLPLQHHQRRSVPPSCPT